jgi:archaellum component FlaC
MRTGECSRQSAAESGGGSEPPVLQEVTMQDLFNKIGKAASTAATTAGQKAEEMKEINKLKGEQSNLKSEYSITKKKLADYVFKLYQADELKDETLREFCDKMQELREEIDQIDKDIENVKEDYAEKASNRGEHRL